ncbi:hypothetical protein BJ546DRAFT_688559 [Cryomyces antarcticus]
MDLEDITRGKFSGEKGLMLVDKDNDTRAGFSMESGGGKGFTADIEILRGDLAKIFYDASCRDAQSIFGDHVTAIEDHEDLVHVTFDKAGPRDFDLVLAADGMGARARRLVFPWRVHPGVFGPIRLLLHD